MGDSACQRWGLTLQLPGSASKLHLKTGRQCYGGPDISSRRWETGRWAKREALACLQRLHSEVGV